MNHPITIIYPSINPPSTIDILISSWITRAQKGHDTTPSWMVPWCSSPRLQVCTSSVEVDCHNVAQKRILSPVIIGVAMWISWQVSWIQHDDNQAESSRWSHWGPKICQSFLREWGDIDLEMRAAIPAVWGIGSTHRIWWFWAII